MKIRGHVLSKLMALGAPLWVGGCVTLASGGATADVLPPCQVEADQSRDWRQVTTNVISFCVPAGWTARGPNEWQGRGGTIRWNPGTLGMSGGQGQRFNEVIDGTPVELWVLRVRGVFQTGAQWRTPRAVHMRGDATSEAAAELQLSIFRTARIEGGS